MLFEPPDFIVLFPRVTWLYTWPCVRETSFATEDNALVQHRGLTNIQGSEHKENAMRCHREANSHAKLSTHPRKACLHPPQLLIASSYESRPVYVIRRVAVGCPSRPCDSAAILSQRAETNSFTDE